MKVKGSHTEQIRQDEQYTKKIDVQEESQEDDHGINKASGPDALLSPEYELLIDILEKDIQRDLADPLLQILAEDPDFNQTLDAICKRRVPSNSPDYSWEDLKQEVLIKFGRWLWRCRYEASFKTILWKIARNQFIDMRRQSDDQCISLEELLPEEEKAKLELPSPRALMDIQDNIQIKEWLEVLEENERQLFIWHHVEGRSLADIARGRCVTRQAVDKQWLRILNKLKPLVSKGNC